MALQSGAGDDLFGMDPTFKSAQRPDQLLTPEDGEDHDQFLVAGDADDTGQYQRLRTAAPKRRTTRPDDRGGGARDVSAAAFSNMSFNDEDEGEVTNDFLSKSANFGSSHSTHNLSSQRGKIAGVNVPPPGQDGTKGGYGCGTWPRKHKHFTPTATAEPFTVKKK